MTEDKLFLIAGLGNPGTEYENTRHNAGFLVVDRLARKNNLALGRRKFNVIFNRGRIAGHDTILAKPQAFMNRSGPPLAALNGFFKIPLQAMLIIHDDIDLAFDRLKIKEKGGDGGHKGIRSIIDAFGTDEFVRLRVGVGRPARDADVVDHVLDAFTPEERRSLDRLLERACEAILTIIDEGTQVAMNEFNQHPS